MDIREWLILIVVFLALLPIGREFNGSPCFSFKKLKVMDMKERQEIWCHECEQFVQFDIDLSLNGNHEIICPNCGHIHYRVVVDGIITEERWNSSFSSSVYTTANITNTSSSTFDTYSTGSTINMLGATGGTVTTMYMHQAWLNTLTS